MTEGDNNLDLGEDFRIVREMHIKGKDVRAERALLTPRSCDGYTI